MEKLHFTILNYTIDYSLHPKLFECTFCTLNYDFYYTLHPNINFLLTWMEKYDIMWKDLIVHILNLLKIKEKLYFTFLN